MSIKLSERNYFNSPEALPSIDQGIVLNHVLPFLSIQDIATCKKVSKAFQDLVNEEELWKQLLERDLKDAKLHWTWFQSSKTYQERYKAALHIFKNSIYGFPNIDRLLLRDPAQVFSLTSWDQGRFAQNFWKTYVRDLNFKDYCTVLEKASTMNCPALLRACIEHPNIVKIKLDKLLFQWAEHEIENPDLIDSLLKQHPLKAKLNIKSLTKKILSWKSSTLASKIILHLKEKPSKLMDILKVSIHKKNFEMASKIFDLPEFRVDADYLKSILFDLCKKDSSMISRWSSKQFIPILSLREESIDESNVTELDFFRKLMAHPEFSHIKVDDLLEVLRIALNKGKYDVCQEIINKSEKIILISSKKMYTKDRLTLLSKYVAQLRAGKNFCLAIEHGDKEKIREILQQHMRNEITIPRHVLMEKLKAAQKQNNEAIVLMIQEVCNRHYLTVSDVVD